MPPNPAPFPARPFGRALLLLALLVLAACAARPTAPAQPAPPLTKLAPPLPALPPPAAQAAPDTPFLRIETGMHTATINRIAVDSQERFLVTASHDKTARVWDLHSGQLLQILRPPIGEGSEGKLYAVAITPDGTTVAMGGFTAPSNTAEGIEADSIYLFDRASGQLTRRISGLPNVVHHLAYSPDGRYLAAALFGNNGLRIYRSDNLHEVAKDTEYGDSSFWVEFDPLGRLVSTSYDGFLRLYDANFNLLAKQAAPGGKKPFAARFSPDGSRIAVGFADFSAVNVLLGDSLRWLYSPDAHGINNGDLGMVAWSKDGQWLYAGGLYVEDSGNAPILRWPQAGRGAYSKLPAAKNTLMDIRALAQNRLVFGTVDSVWGILDPSGQRLSGQTPLIADYRDITQAKLQLDETGGAVEFQLGPSSPSRRFDLLQHRWLSSPAASPALHPARTRFC